MSPTLQATAVALIALLSAGDVHAERADRFQATEIKSREGGTDLVTHTTMLSGDVELRRGTLLIKADKAVLTQDAQGFQHIVMTAEAGGKPVFFRQKRDGAQNQWMEGEARRVVYDDRSETVELLVEAKARRTTDGAVTDEASGERIAYQSREECYVVTQLPGGTASGDRRATMVLQPSRKDPLNLPATAASATASANVPW